MIRNSSTVSIVKGGKNPDEFEINKMVRRAVKLAGGLDDIIRPGSMVLIKPNVVAAKSPQTGATTDPRVVKSITRIVKKLKAYPLIGESSAVGVNTEDAFRATLIEEGYEVVDLKKLKKW